MLTVYANYYQSLLDLYNDRKTLEGLYVEIGQNLSKRVATEVERSNLSFIAIYGGVAKWNPNELGNKLSTLTVNSPYSINEASLAPDAKEYRTEHYVNLVVLCVASHLSRGKTDFANPEEIKNAIQDKTGGLKRFIHLDVFTRLMSLNAGDIERILNYYNFENLYILAKEYAQFDESLRVKPGKMPGEILYLSPNHAIRYEEALPIINELNRDARSSASAGGGATAGGGASSARSAFAGGGASSTRSTLSNLLRNRAAPIPPVLNAATPPVLNAAADDVSERRQIGLEALLVRGLIPRTQTAMPNPSASGATTVTSEGTVTGDATAGAWTIERLQADAIRQINESALSDDLTEDAYDAAGKEIKISLKEKAQRAVAIIVSSSEKKIKTDIMSIEQLAKQIEAVLLGKKVTYNNPIASVAPTGGYQRQATNSNAKKQASGAGNKSAPTLSIAEQALAQKAKKAGISVEEYKKQQEEREAEDAKRNLDAVTKAQKQGSGETATQRNARLTQESEALIENALSQIETLSDVADILEPDGGQISLRQKKRSEFETLVKNRQLKVIAISNGSSDINILKGIINQFFIEHSLGYIEPATQGPASIPAAGGASRWTPKVLTPEQQEKQRQIQQKRDEDDAKILGITLENVQRMTATERRDLVNRRKLEIKEEKDAEEFGMSVENIRRLTQAQKSNLRRQKMQNERDRKENDRLEEEAKKFEKIATDKGLSVEELRLLVQKEEEEKEAKRLGIAVEKLQENKAAAEKKKSKSLEEIAEESRRKVEESGREEKERKLMENEEAKTRGISVSQLRRKLERKEIEAAQKGNALVVSSQQRRRGSILDPENDESDDEGDRKFQDSLVVNALPKPVARKKPALTTSNRSSSQSPTSNVSSSQPAVAPDSTFFKSSAEMLKQAIKNNPLKDGNVSDSDWDD